jgi:hypothetical protein
MASPNDSAISVAAASMIPSSSDKPSSNPPSRRSDEKARSKSNSPPLAHGPGHAAPTPAEQEAQELENAAAVAQAQASIAVDSASDNDGLSDAGYETDSLRSGSTSISSSVRDYMFENWRRYHRFREGAYNFPNDESEQEREDMKHAMVLTLCQTLHFAPLGETPGNILDLGTGTGAWAIDSEFYLYSDVGLKYTATDEMNSGRYVPISKYHGS